MADHIGRDDALANNLHWYGCVMDAHDILYEKTEHVWLTTAAVPPYYSNLVTRSLEGADEQLACIGALVAVPPQPRWGIADSFAALDAAALEAMGLELLFDAVWHGLPGDCALPLPSETDVVFSRVRDAQSLAAWEDAWQVWSPAPGKRVFPPSLLAVPGVTFWVARREGDVVGGAITHVDGATLGLSNVFAGGSAASGALLRDAARMAHGAGEGRAVVGYGSAQDLGDLTPLGFESLGGQRVWLSA